MLLLPSGLHSLCCASIPVLMYCRIHWLLLLPRRLALCCPCFPSMPVSSPVLQYSFTNYLIAIIVALTLGQIGSSTPETPNFTTQVHQVREDEGFVLLADE